MKSVVCFGDCLIFAKYIYYLLSSLVACMSDSYYLQWLTSLIKSNYKTMKYVVFLGVSRQLVYRHFVYDTSSTDILSTDISSTMTFLAEIEAGVMKRILYQQ